VHIKALRDDRAPVRSATRLTTGRGGRLRALSEANDKEEICMCPRKAVKQDEVSARLAQADAEALIRTTARRPNRRLANASAT